MQLSIAIKITVPEPDNKEQVVGNRLLNLGTTKLIFTINLLPTTYCLVPIAHLCIDTPLPNGVLSISQYHSLVKQGHTWSQ
jgi:hypothetical protein